jgi:hypothetical protein
VVLGARLLSPLATVFVVLGASACWYLVRALSRHSIGTLHACFVVFGNVVFGIWKRRKTTSATQLEMYKCVIGRPKGKQGNANHACRNTITLMLVPLSQVLICHVQSTLKPTALTHAKDANAKQNTVAPMTRSHQGIRPHRHP